MTNPTPASGPGAEEPEIGQEDDIPSDDQAPVAEPLSPPAEAPKPVNPEPTQAPGDPEGDRVKTSVPGKPEHPRP